MSKKREESHAHHVSPEVAAAAARPGAGVAPGMGSAAVSRIAGSDVTTTATGTYDASTCIARIRVPSHYASEPAGDTHVQLVEGAGSTCPAVFDPETLLLTVRLTPEEAAPVFGPKEDRPPQAPRLHGIDLGNDLSFRGDRVSYRPNENTNISVGRIGGKWAVKAVIKF